jgi:aminoglycoside phosphotransferase (APT) family kinase protein
VPAIHVAPERFADHAPTLGRFLSALHAFPADQARRLGVPHHDIDALLDECRIEALEDFHLVRDVAPEAPHEAWLAWLSAPPALQRTSRPIPSTTVMLHNDLAAEHVLCDPETGVPTGVIDWSDMALGDPAVDFAGLFHSGGDRFAKAVLGHYDGHVDEHGLARARFLAACRGVGDVRFGLDLNRREYLAAGIRALELCAH